MKAQPRSAIGELAQERQELWTQAAQSYVMDEFAVRRLINKLDKLLGTLSAGIVAGE